MDPHQLNAREQAKLEDFVRKDLHNDTAPATPNAASAPQPGVAVPGISSHVRELTHDLKQKASDSNKRLNPLTPSIADERPSDQQIQPPAPSDELDVDMFARTDVNKVVAEIKHQRAEEERRELARKAGLPFVSLLGYPISPDVLGIAPYDMSQNHGVVAYLRAGKKVRLGVLDPTNQQTAEAIRTLRDNTPYEFIISAIGDDSYRYAMKLYDELPKHVRDSDDVTVSAAGRTDFERDIQNLEDLKAKISDLPTTKLIDILLTGAVKVGASDVHIEPTENAIKVRYRLDGVLEDVVELPSKVTNALLSRLKFLAKLKLDLNKMPQDGRFTINDEGNASTSDAEPHQIDVRVATIPVQYGEAVTMRLLDRQTLNLSIDSLGLTGEPLRQVQAAIKRPQGMILECGPTGSGKTTTLYAFLNQLNDPGKKVITLEDPVEYRLAGVLQSQIEPDQGYDFHHGFRSVLRLDPDIVMVGEIRDKETADMATQASLTGHIVLSTLHTNDAPTAIPRLIDLGVRPFLLSNSINVIIAQRLVRKVCPDCAVEHQPDAGVKEEIKHRLAGIAKASQDAVPREADWLFLSGQGCPRCNNTGFKGRIGIFEVLVPDETIEQLAIASAPVSQIRQASLERGMMTMEQDGLVKALTGVTTIDEVWRVARDI